MKIYTFTKLLGHYMTFLDEIQELSQEDFISALCRLSELR